MIHIKDITPIYLNHKLPPETPEDFLTFQTGLLSKYTSDFLVRIIEILENDINQT